MVVVCKIAQAPSTVPVLLFPPIPFDGLGMSFAILLPVIGMALTPFPRTVQADLAILRIRLDVVFRAALTLAFGFATNRLLRPVRGGLKLLLAIAATTSDRQGRLLCLSFSSQDEFRVYFCRVPTASPAWGNSM